MELIDVTSVWPPVESAQGEFMSKILTGFDLKMSCKKENKDTTVQGDIHGFVIEAAKHCVTNDSSKTPVTLQCALRSCHDAMQDGVVDCNTMYQRILEPCDVTAELVCTAQSEKAHLTLDQFVVNLNPECLNIARDVQTQLLDPLMQSQAGKPTAPCVEYHVVYTMGDNVDVSNDVTFWRPQPPPGYAIMGDVVMMGHLPLSRQVTQITHDRHHPTTALRLSAFR